MYIAIHRYLCQGQVGISFGQLLDGVLQIRLGRGQLLVGFGRLNFRQQFAGLHLVANVDVALAEITGDTRIDHGILVGLGRGWQRPVAGLGRKRLDDIDAGRRIRGRGGNLGQVAAGIEPGDDARDEKAEKDRGEDHGNADHRSCWGGARDVVG